MDVCLGMLPPARLDACYLPLLLARQPSHTQAVAVLVACLWEKELWALRSSLCVCQDTRALYLCRWEYCSIMKAVFTEEFHVDPAHFMMTFDIFFSELTSSKLRLWGNICVRITSCGSGSFWGWMCSSLNSSFFSPKKWLTVCYLLDPCLSLSAAYREEMTRGGGKVCNTIFIE